MAPGHQIDELTILRLKLAEMEADLEFLKRRQVSGEKRFRELLDAAPMMVWMSGTDAMCTFFNRAWLDFRGRNSQQELGNGWTEGIHPDDRDLSLETYLKAFSARTPFRTQYRIHRAGGEYAWIESCGTPLIEDTVFVGFMGTAMDVSERRNRMFLADRESVRLVFALTERERQVLVLIASGKSTKEAASQLGISYKTADSHRSRILEKLGVHETASMVRYAIRAGLIEA
ncbi:MAG: LuxR C-terminal-related transcriptional regulator [Candidatus Solibacter sp.]